MATVVVSFSYSSCYNIISKNKIKSNPPPTLLLLLLLRFNPFSSSSSSLSAVTTIIRPIIRMSITNQNNNKPNHNNTHTTTILPTNTEEEEEEKKRKRRRLVLLFDVMDTIVRDPFYQHIPAFFGMSLKELIDCKNPTAWIDFETGLIDEMELARIFFKDERPFDLEGLKSCMRRGFSYLQGMEELLHVLKQNNYEMHALTNYPIWYEMIEDKLKLSKYLSWSFCSCSIGKRKPDPKLYAEVVRQLETEPENCIFIDDRMRNVEAAMAAGMVGLQFKDAKTLRKDLSLLGIQTEYQDYNV